MGVVLASNSPRRKELLKFIYQDFTISPANIDETVPSDVPAEESAMYLAEKKADAVARHFPNDLVIGCDTIVLYDGKVLGKPTSEEDSFHTLKALSGNVHKVITSVCLANNDFKVCFSETTEVTFYELTDEEIWKYIATGEPTDKAGSYGIQGYGSLLVKRINGDYFNVVGLPVSKMNRVLKEHGSAIKQNT